MPFNLFWDRPWELDSMTTLSMPWSKLSFNTLLMKNISGVVFGVSVLAPFTKAPSVPIFVALPYIYFIRKYIKEEVVVFPFVPVTPTTVIFFDG